MQLGAFSLSLAVKDLEVSRRFYENLGFSPLGGDPAHNWIILNNGGHVIGLFQGMFEGNMMTFNPGWDQGANELSEFTDVRELQQDLKRRGVTLEAEADVDGTGPASIMLIDPDGNRILIDQHC